MAVHLLVGIPPKPACQCPEETKITATRGDNVNCPGCLCTLAGMKYKQQLVLREFGFAP